MSIVWSEQIDPILSRGISLEHLGVRNWALGRDDALHAIYELEAFGIAILGGDVYKLVGEKAEQTYDSWYCDQGPDESDSVFSKRSSDKAKNYIFSYLMPEGLFAIVPKN
ncbi:Imm40 family immunity protein [Rhodococcus sp. IEGM1300]